MAKGPKRATALNPFFPSVCTGRLASLAGSLRNLRCKYSTFKRNDKRIGEESNPIGKVLEARPIPYLPDAERKSEESNPVPFGIRAGFQDRLPPT